MIAVIFEVEPHPDQRHHYLDIAAKLKLQLETIDGFISVERFQSLSDPNKLLSLSIFRDEEAVKEWRSLQSHREAQAAGRTSVFKNYRLRVATVLRDYGLHERDEAPTDSLREHDS